MIENEKLRALLAEARETLLAQHDPQDNIAMTQRIDAALAEPVEKKKQIVKLYAVGWRRTAPDEETVEPFLVVVDATENEASYIVLEDQWFGKSAGYEAGRPFHYASRLLKIDREEWGIGLTPKEAINLAFAAEVKRREKANEELSDIERSVSALLRLELKEVRS